MVALHIPTKPGAAVQRQSKVHRFDLRMQLKPPGLLFIPNPRIRQVGKENHGDMRGDSMHFEILVEDQSGKKALEKLP